MSGWGTPEQEAERRRMQAEEDRRRREQEAARRFADTQARQRAEEDRRRRQTEETLAMMDGAAGNSHSHRRFSNPASFLSGSMAAGRDVTTGKTRTEIQANAQPISQTSRTQMARAQNRKTYDPTQAGPSRRFIWAVEAAIEWSVRLLGAAIFIGLFYLVADSVDLFPW